LLVRGFVSSVVTWLLSGGSLALHHPADLQVLESQIVDEHHDTLIAPAPLALRLAESGTLARRRFLRHVVGLWRTPDRVAASNDWQDTGTTLTDVYLFGEIGLFGRGAATTAHPRPQTGTIAPRGAASSKTIGDIIVTPKGTLALRGAMVPVAAYRIPSDDPLKEAAPIMSTPAMPCMLIAQRGTSASQRHLSALSASAAIASGAGSRAVGQAPERRRDAHRVAGSTQRLPPRRTRQRQ
jgi:hypothetical protein